MRLSRDQSHYLARVLRLSEGDPLVVFDGRGQEATATVMASTSANTEIAIEGLCAVSRESSQKITVIQALCTGDKMDWVVQKATELGASEIWPVHTHRSLVRLDQSRADKRRDHWQRIAEAAAAQCGRNYIPEIAPVQVFEKAVPQARAQELTTAWLLDPFASETVSSAPLQGALTIAIGPEAGFTDQEEAIALGAGFVGVRCGPRILRTETAAATVIAAVATRLGEF